MRRLVLLLVLLLPATAIADQGWQDNQFAGGFYLYDFPTPLQLRGGVTVTDCKIGEIAPFAYSDTLQCTSMDQFEMAYDGGSHLNSLGLADFWLQSLSERNPLDGEPISDWNTGGQVSGYYVRGPTYNFTTGASTNTEGIGLWTFGQPTFSSNSPATAVSLQNATFYVPAVSNITAAGPYGIRVVSGSTDVGIEVDGTYQAAGLGGSGTRCVQVDNTGKMAIAAGACGTGTGTVTSVTGTATQILCTPSSPNPVCSLIATAVTPGSYTNTSFTVDALGRLTAASSGTAPLTSIGVTDPVTTTGGTTPTIGSKFDNTSITLNGGGGIQRAALTGDITAPVGNNATTLKNTGIGAGSCTGCSVTFDAQGRETTYSSVSYQAPLTACTDYVHLACQGVSSDISNTDANVEVTAIHESGGLRIPIGACTADGQAFVKVAGLMTCRLPSADLTNDYTAPWVTGMHDNSGASWPVNGNFSNGSVLSMAAGKLVAATVASQATKHDYFAVVSLTASIASGQFLPTSQSQFLATGLSGETPNDFQAGHVQMRMNFIACTGVAATALTCFATLNGSGIAGTGLSITCGTTSPGVQVGTAVPTGSASANDVFGVECSGSVALAGQLDTFSEQMVLTP